LAAVFTADSINEGSDDVAKTVYPGVPYCTMVAVFFEAPFHKAPL
jgi:hypothetical protein